MLVDPSVVNPRFQIVHDEEECMVDTNKVECQNCTFWDILRAGLYPGGACLRSSPIRSPAELRCWPITAASDWCGEFRSQETVVQLDKVGD